MLYHNIIAATDTPDTVSESDNDEPVYKIKFDLDDLLASTLNEYCDSEKEDDAKSYYDSLDVMGAQLRLAERKISNFL